jgi:hypothetical protein
MHFIDLKYQGISEGADYPDGEPGVNFHIPEGVGVPHVKQGLVPCGYVVYKWIVPELAGSNEIEPARIHSYYSYVCCTKIRTPDSSVLPSSIVRGKWTRSRPSTAIYPSYS